MTATTDKTTGPTVPTLPRLLKPADVAVYLGLGRSQTYALIASGQLATVRWGGHLRVTEREMEAFVRRATVDRSA